jgi:hypothetical protein
MNSLAKTIQTHAGGNYLAAFDLDHTIIRGDIGDQLFRTLDSQGLLQRLPIYADCSSGLDEGELLFDYEGEESAWELYQRALRQVGTRGAPSLVGDIYAWMTQSMSGLSVLEVCAATEESWYKNHLTMRAETLRLMAALLNASFEVRVVSATNIWSVRWIVEQLLNPLLVSMTGKRIRPDLVHGMRVTLSDSVHPDGKPRLTPCLELPCTTFEGKRATILQNSAKSLLLACGDSPNDDALLRSAQYRVIVDRPEHRSWAQKLRDSTPVLTSFTLGHEQHGDVEGLPNITAH